MPSVQPAERLDFIKLVPKLFRESPRPALDGGSERNALREPALMNEGEVIPSESHSRCD
jgi:hypothetical protein